MPADLTPGFETFLQHLLDAKEASTRGIYLREITRFFDWCRIAGLRPRPAAAESASISQQTNVGRSFKIGRGDPASCHCLGSRYFRIRPEPC
ncbi:MAG: hypothetical protein GY696_05330 [Gammaproteobacteria bacterium]|nr:hypothetical protein [Gammaproteobacteria bacterium]